MNFDERLGEIVSALESVGVESIVMGGHAVRFHALKREA